MNQQINLYQGVLDNSQSKPVISQAVFASIAILLLLLSYSLYLVFNLNTTKDNLKSAKQQLLEASTRTQLLQIQYPKQQINQLLIKEISHSQDIQASLTQVIDMLNDTSSDQNQGFSRYFSAFARQSIADVWLNTIIINSEKHSIEIGGSTYKSARMPVFLQNLHHEAVFQGRNFSTLLMTQDQENDNQINFTVNTSTDSEEQKNHD